MAKNLDLGMYDSLLENNIEPTTEEPVDTGNIIDDSQENPEEGEEVIDNNPPHVEDVLVEFLKTKGIEDPSKIKFENDEGNVEELNFNELSREEQFNILREVTDPGLNEHEIEVVNYLRSNNVTLNQVIEHFAEQRLQEYLKQNPDAEKKQTYSVDEYSDDDLFIADTKSKFPVLTEDELKIELEKAKENEDLFKKKTQVLRESYKSQEDTARENEIQQEKEQQEMIVTNLKNAANSLAEIPLDYTDPKSDTLLIEDADRQQVLSYLLDRDSSGRSEFIKDLEDPSKLVQLAWFMKQGNEVFSGISKYWKDTLKKERQETNKLRKELDKLKNIEESVKESSKTSKPVVGHSKSTPGLFDDII